MVMSPKLWTYYSQQTFRSKEFPSMISGKQELAKKSNLFSKKLDTHIKLESSTLCIIELKKLLKARMIKCA